MPRERWSQYSTVFLRCALGTAFLSAVADRFGVWGAPGQPGVAWGDFAHFQIYAAQVNAFGCPSHTDEFPTAFQRILTFHNTLNVMFLK